MELRNIIRCLYDNIPVSSGIATRLSKKTMTRICDVMKNLGFVIYSSKAFKISLTVVYYVLIAYWQRVASFKLKENAATSNVILKTDF